MKKVLMTLAMGIFALAAMAQQPVLTFEKTSHDFGEINEDDGRVTTVFTFKNEGMAPLVLSNVRASCGCTTPKWPRQPIEPGQTGEITVTYNPKGRPGQFSKTITITSNATEATQRIYIKGKVIPKPTKPADKYPVKMGELSLKSKLVSFGLVDDHTAKTLEIEYANQTDHAITVDIAPANGQEKYLDAIITLGKLEPKETGLVQIHLATEGTGIYGPVDGTFLIVVNGEVKQSEEFTIHATAEVEEDFSRLTAEQLHNAPIMDVATQVNMGIIKDGKSAKRTINITNVGINPLKIHRVYNDNSELTATTNKTELKNGKAGQLKIEVKTNGLKQGNYSRTIVVITNDPKNPKQKIEITWTVE